MTLSRVRQFVLSIHREIVVAFLAALTVTFADCAAQAQIVQPQYVRPSKGASVFVFPGADGKGLPANTNILTNTSAVYDFSAFESAQVFVSAQTTSGAACAASFATVTIIAQGSFSKTTGFVNVADPYGAYTQTAFGAFADAYSLSDLPTYVKFSAGTGANADASCRLQINIIPVPFASTANVQGRVAANGTFLGAYPVLMGGSDYVAPPNQRARMLKVDSNGAISATTLSSRYFYTNQTLTSIPSGAATRVLTVTVAEEGARLQNAGNQTLYCGFASTASSASYSFALKASASPDDGTGGVIDLPYKGQPTSGIWCAVSGVTAGTLASFTYVHP
jgi:hypothetical protein